MDQRKGALIFSVSKVKWNGAQRASPSEKAPI